MVFAVLSRAALLPGCFARVPAHRRDDSAELLVVVDRHDKSSGSLGDRRCEGCGSGRTRATAALPHRGGGRASHPKRGYGLRRTALEATTVIGSRPDGGVQPRRLHHSPARKRPRKPEGTGEEPVGSRPGAGIDFMRDLSSAAISTVLSIGSRSIGGK